MRSGYSLLSLLYHAFQKTDHEDKFLTIVNTHSDSNIYSFLLKKGSYGPETASPGKTRQGKPADTVGSVSPAVAIRNFIHEEEPPYLYMALRTRH